MIDNTHFDKNFYTKILDSIGDGMIHTDSDGKILYINKVAEKILNLNKTVINQDIKDVFQIYDAKTLLKDKVSVDSVLKNGFVIGLKKNSVYIDRQGHQAYLSATLSPILDDTIIQGMIILFRDITRIIETEKELRILSSAVEQSPTSIVITDTDGIIEYVNPTFTEITGYEKSEVIGKNPNILKTNYRDSNYYKNLWNTILSGEIWKGEFLNKKKSGELYWEEALISAIRDDDDEIIKFLAIKEDISERKKISRVLRDSERRLRLITDNMKDAIIQTDEDGVIEYASPSTVQLLGYQAEDLISKSIYTLIHDDEKEKMELLKKENQKLKDIIEIRILNGNGTYNWIEATVNEINDMEIKGKVFICRDITVKKRAEEEMKKSIAAAESTSKAKSQFLANMSHEIRTPMNGILGMTTLTLMTDLTKTQRENLELVKNSADSLIRIINSILDFSKIEAGKLILEELDFDINTLVEKTIASFKYKAEEKGIDINSSINIKENKVYVGDPGRIQQILTNLIGNAVKFTEYGYVKLIVDTLLENDNSAILQFSVVDTGIGIPKDKIRNLFESFSQIDGSITRKYGGTGLGLAISKQLIEMMHGEIVVESIEGKGSSFIFTIQLNVSAHKSHLEDNESFDIPTSEKKLKILLVEDDKINQMVTIALIEKQGHSIELANNGIEAISKYKNEKFDLILMDIQMPEMDGIEATKKIRAYELNGNEYTPIIAVTAHAVQGDRERFLESGMDDYISKPLDIVKFYDIIRKHTGYDKNEVEKEAVRLEEIKHIITTPQEKKEYKSEEKAIIVSTIKEHLNNIEANMDKKQFSKIENNSKFIKSYANDNGLSEISKIGFKIQLEARKEDSEKIDKLIKEIQENLDMMIKESI